HGESDDVLTKGAAHLEHTSFPIGGENTHACISAHSGYPTQKFFDDIDELENGDEIYIYVLNRTMKYTVTDKDVVEPDDSSKLEVVQGKDLLTLVTCTPYGINSHRLLIHAERVPFAVATHDSAATISQLTESNYYSSQLQIVIAGFVVIAVVIVKIYYWRRKRKRIRQQTEVTK
ncbi:MAG: class C sortase, partial [Ruminococcus sp.]|nr:class C sortase [Ruminococcus sp.]